MAHYAFLDENNRVTEVIVGRDEGTDGQDWEQIYAQIRGQTCRRTSYNTHGGVYYLPETGRPGPDQSRAFRGNYAGIGWEYRADIDAFVPPQPWPSWTLDPVRALWQAPVPRPQDHGTGDPQRYYRWDESQQQWILEDQPEISS